MEAAEFPPASDYLALSRKSHEVNRYVQVPDGEGLLRPISGPQTCAAGVELEIRGIGNFLMARGFWSELLDVAVLAAARCLH